MYICIYNIFVPHCYYSLCTQFSACAAVCGAVATGSAEEPHVSGHLIPRTSSHCCQQYPHYLFPQYIGCIAAWSLLVTVCHYMVTVGHCTSLYVTVCHCMSLYVTVGHCWSLFVCWCLDLCCVELVSLALEKCGRETEGRERVEEGTRAANTITRYMYKYV